MDKLSHYVQRGKGYGLKKMLGISLIFCLIAGGLLYIALNRLPDMIEKDTTLDDMPTVLIQNGQVAEPVDTVWTKTIDTGIPFVLQIDTQTAAQDKTTHQNGAYLTRDALYLKSMNQVKIVNLPQEKLLLNKSILIDILRNSIHSTILILVLFIFSLLWIGFIGTIVITSLIVWVVQKKIPAGAAARASLIGWLMVITLDFALLTLGIGFSLTTAMFLAALPGLFLLFGTVPEKI